MGWWCVCVRGCVLAPSAHACGCPPPPPQTHACPPLPPRTHKHPPHDPPPLCPRPRERLHRPQTRRRRENNDDSLEKLRLLRQNVTKVGVHVCVRVCARCVGWGDVCGGGVGVGGHDDSLEKLRLLRQNVKKTCVRACGALASPAGWLSTPPHPHHLPPPFTSFPPRPWTSSPIL